MLHARAHDGRSHKIAARYTLIYVEMMVIQVIKSPIG
jgi:hypothetical protein